jgi:hypothetical protein
MKDDVFNMEIRKFLKTVGVASQREIERAVSEALSSGKIKGNEKLDAKMTLSIGKLNFSHTIDGKIALE